MDNTRQLAKEFAAVRVIHDNVVSEAVRKARLGQYMIANIFAFLLKSYLQMICILILVKQRRLSRRMRW